MVGLSGVETSLAIIAATGVIGVVLFLVWWMTNRSGTSPAGATATGPTRPRTPADYTDDHEEEESLLDDLRDAKRELRFAGLRFSVARVDSRSVDKDEKTEELEDANRRRRRGRAPGDLDIDLDAV